jgi:hypothetical protein
MVSYVAGDSYLHNDLQYTSDNKAGVLRRYSTPGCLITAPQSETVPPSPKAPILLFVLRYAYNQVSRSCSDIISVCFLLLSPNWACLLTQPTFLPKLFH